MAPNPSSSYHAGAAAHPSEATSALDRALEATWAGLLAPGSPFAVETVDVHGQSVKQFAQTPSSLSMFWAGTRAFSDQIYLVYDDERLSYRETHDRVDRVAHWLTKQGVGHGDRVAIAMRNYPEWMIIQWAAIKVGAAIVGINAWWSADEICFALGDAQPKVIFCDAERLERLAMGELLARMSIVAIRTAPPANVVAWATVLESGDEIAHAEPNIGPDDNAFVLYTSGTTGRSKGALLTHCGCLNSVMNILFAHQAFVGAETVALDGAAVDPQGSPPRILVTTPLFHVTALNQAHVATGLGGTIVLMRKWAAGEALRLIETERITSISGVPTMLRELLDHPDVAKRDISPLATLAGGGAQTTPDIVHKISARIAHARAATGYGMTEASGPITAIGGKYFETRSGSCGRILPTFEVKLIDESGERVPEGSPGEICVRGAGVITGYLNHPSATAETIVDGWLHTGDIGTLDRNGYLTLIDRKKDMILRGGENVYCSEVEVALFDHPAVAEACVFSVPDERLGEEVGAVVVLHKGSSTQVEMLRAHVETKIAKFKVPRYIWIVENALPRNASGKFMRHAIREQMAAKTAE